MSPDLLPWALLVTFLVGSATGIGATFYLTTVSAPWIHSGHLPPHGPACDRMHPGDRVLPQMSVDMSGATLHRARLCGANVCPRCLELVRRV